ncbi:MAG TPA: hypothetical protein VI006_18010 [Solirubrobacteraceae bacterium]
MRDGAFGILEGYTRALRSARELVYLESQFFWLPEIVHLLSEKLREPPSDRFRIVVLLPSKANNGEEDTRECSPTSPTPTAVMGASWPRRSTR